MGKQALRAAGRKSADAAVAVEAIGVSKIFGQGDDRVVALDDVHVAIGENEFFTLLGPSGCGKTTLLRLIAGFDHPSQGRIVLHGADITALPPFKRPVNTVFQNYALFPHMTVAGNIGFGLEMLGKPRPEINARVDEMLRLVRMSELKNRLTSQISGGQQQRVALARALAPSPEVLLLDEPLSALDLKLRKEMQIELKRLQHETGITFIFVTHDQEEALTMSDRVAVMNRGRILQIGRPRDIYDRPAERFVANFIGDTNFLEAEMLPAGKVKLPSGKTAAASLPDGFDGSRGKAVTIVVRPEHAEIAGPAAGLLRGELSNIVYFGTDTHFHVDLDSGGEFIVRRQNLRGNEASHAVGDRVGIAFKDDAVQVLKD